MTTASTTLRQLSGLPATPARLSDSALIIVDAQNAYRSGVMQLEGVEPALDECARLLARARTLKIPVVHIQHDAGPGSPSDPNAECGAIADKVAMLHGGVIRWTGPVAEMDETPDPYVQQFIHGRAEGPIESVR